MKDEASNLNFNLLLEIDTTAAGRESYIKIICSRLAGNRARRYNKEDQLRDPFLRQRQDERKR